MVVSRADAEAALVRQLKAGSITPEQYIERSAALWRRPRPVTPVSDLPDSAARLVRIRSMLRRISRR